MGTRSITNFLDEEGKGICTLYRQFDGYFEGHGKDLAEFLAGMKLVNGYNQDHENGHFANGMSCLAAQIVSHFKEGIGNFHLQAYDPDETQEYVYIIEPMPIELQNKETNEQFWNRAPQDIRITIQDSGRQQLFQGSPEDLLTFIVIEHQRHQEE